MTENQNPQQDEFDALIQLLPACTRCRTVRKRCDTLLPSCANCKRSGLQCNFYDSVSNELLPREYVFSMIQHLRSIESARSTTSNHPRSPTSPLASNGTLFEVRNTPRFLGNRSPIAEAGRWASVCSPVQDSHSKCPQLTEYTPGPISDAMHEFLVRKYVDTIHDVFPIFDEETLAILSSLPFGASDSPRRMVLLKLIYSIACHCLPANDNRLLMLSDSLYRDALVQFETVMKNHGLEALQTIVLLTIRSLFDATAGNIGQLVNFAHRFEIELSSHNIPEMVPILQRLQSTALASTTKHAQILCSMYSLYTHWRERDSYSPRDTARLFNCHRDFESSSLLLITARQVQFLIEPSIESAKQILTTYNDQNSIYNSFSSHWIYRAASHVISHSDSEDAVQINILAAGMLERCASKWPNSRLLQEALNSTRQRRGQ
ncbi:uncharacterized protein BDV14DRAFT_209729 [Aspergillus stella-maris]|uniref:uncharacterized protein n=1 Tax=Aspergillus stella-maris TaxID=1810926 RepID=UPI003CCD169D